MTIHNASQQLRFQLFHLYDEREAGNIMDLVMEQISGWKKIDRIVNKTVPLSTAQLRTLDTYTKALLEHTPVQYVLHEAWFYGMQLYVDENVLIPRPETEELVDWLVRDATALQTETALSILDIGTGSGCIPLGIKKKLPGSKVHACDISTGALKVAEKNASAQQLKIHFHLADILSVESRDQLPLFNIIISNPPYIPRTDKKDMRANVLRHEPEIALFTPVDDPLVFYRSIADFAATHLKEDGSLYLEIHEDKGSDIVELYQQKGFTQIELRKDLQEKDRMVKLKR